MTPPKLAHVWFLTLAVCVPGIEAQERHERYQNLQVLPQDISPDELTDIMLGNLRGLGLRRLEGRGCLFCHVGSLDQPRSEWDWAADDKPMKRKARVMMTMVQAINGEHLPQLESRIDASTRVTCNTCHAGRTDPRPLPDVLWTAYQAAGIDSVETAYRALHQRYVGGAAYDFRVGVLAGVAGRMANDGALDDAIALSALNDEFHPDEPVAKRGWFRLVLTRTVDARGVDAALDELELRAPDLGNEVVTPNLLDGLGWWLFRRDRQAEAIVLFRANLERFPEEYVPNESIAFALFDTGEEDAAIEVLERWLRAHPDHDRARRLIVNLRGS